MGRLVKDFSDRLSVIGHPSSVKWDGTDISGRQVSRGVYFVVLLGENTCITEKAVLVD